MMMRNRVILGNDLYPDRIESGRDAKIAAFQNHNKGRVFCSWITLTILFCISTSHVYHTYFAFSENEMLLKEKVEDLQDCLKDMDEQDKIISSLELDLQKAKNKFTSTDISHLKQTQSLPSTLVTHQQYPSYDLRDVLFLPRDTPDNGVMHEFLHRWQLKSNIYGRCGLVKSRPHYKKPIFPKPTCSVAVITSWFPRPCGIATHSAKLVEGLRHVCPLGSSLDVIAVRNPNEKDVVYPPIVKHTFDKDNLEQYIKTGEWINERRYDMVIAAYEFGLYGDELFMCLLRGIQNAMVVTILHTLADNLPMQKHALTQQAIMLSHKMVLMTETMRSKMDIMHRVPHGIVEVIPHGVPVLPKGTSHTYRSKTSFGTDRKIIFTNGLIHQGKGLEFAIKAMPDVLKRHPTALLVIQGEPHPTGEGTEEYYRNLRELVVTAGLHDSVQFNRTFMPDEELWDRLMSSNMYLNSYVDEVASVSGTLIMAMGMGLPCVSTPYPFAVEALSNGRGVLVPFREASVLAKAISYVLDDEERAKEMGKSAQKYTVSWDEVAQKFINLLHLQ